jgi:integrase
MRRYYPFISGLSGESPRRSKKPSKRRARLYWIPFFKGKALGEITRQHVKNFSAFIAGNLVPDTATTEERKELSSLTLQRIMDVGVTALRWAYFNHYIPANPVEGLMSYSSKSRKRGVLSPQEAIALFNLDWKDNRALLANLTAMTTGLRIGEILALRREDIGEDYLSIEHSYSRADGLKSTKTDEPRLVPVIPQVRDALRRLGEQNPYTNRFIFFCDKEDRPWDQEGALLALKRMLIRLKLGDSYVVRNWGKSQKPEALKAREEAKKARQDAADYWKKRNVVFHSWPGNVAQATSFRRTNGG